MVSVTTIRPGVRHDPACILKPGEHDFIRDESCVAYAFCRVEPAEKLARGVESGAFQDRGLLAEPVFNRVLAGLKQSQSTKPFAIEFLEQYAKQLRQKGA
jgi:hypothetical protein